VQVPAKDTKTPIEITVPGFVAATPIEKPETIKPCSPMHVFDQYMSSEMVWCMGAHCSPTRLFWCRIRRVHAGRLSLSSFIGERESILTNEVQFVQLNIEKRDLKYDNKAHNEQLQRRKRGNCADVGSCFVSRDI
jgi:hypothetical protein